MTRTEVKKVIKALSVLLEKNYISVETCLWSLEKLLENAKINGIKFDGDPELDALLVEEEEIERQARLHNE